MNPRGETYLAHGEPASGQAVLTWNGGAVRGKHKVGLWGSVIAFLHVLRSHTVRRNNWRPRAEGQRRMTKSGMWQVYRAQCHVHLGLHRHTLGQACAKGEMLREIPQVSDHDCP